MLASTPEMAKATAIHPVRPHAHQPRHGEILGRRPHLHADARAAEEQDQTAHQREGHDDRRDLQPRHPEPAEIHALAQLRHEIHAHRPRAEDHQHDMLHQIGHGEGGDQQRRRIGAAQRPEGQPLHAERQDRHHEYRRQRHHDVGLARQAVERESADHDQLAMGEIDQPHDAEDQPDAERGQRVDGAQADGVDGVLQDDHGARAPLMTPK